MEASNQYRTALSRARGLGSAKEGVNRFIGERVTGMALAPLSLWAVWAGFRIAAGGLGAADQLLGSPVHAIAAVLLVVFSAAHMEMGMRVIVEDYVDKPGPKIALLLLNAAFCWLVGALGVFSILKVALLGAGA